MEHDHHHIDNFRLRPEPLLFTREERLRHLLVCGRTGVGKSSFLYNLLKDDIASGVGVGFIDPHGDEFHRLLDAIPSERSRDVVAIDMSDTEFPISFNPIAGVPDDQKQQRVAAIVSAFAHGFRDAWGHASEELARNSVSALIETPDMSLVALPRLWGDSEFRTRRLARVRDPLVRQFWDNFDQLDTDRRLQRIGPLGNKVGELLANHAVRNVLAAGRNRIDPRAIIDGKKILLLNLSRGIIGESACRIFGGLLLSLLGDAAMSRNNLPEHERSEFRLIADEAHDYLSTSTVAILTGARKYAYGVVLATQYLESIDREVRAALLGTVANIVCFSVSPADAEVLAPQFGPLDPDELVTQGIGHAWVKRLEPTNAYTGSTRLPMQLPERELISTGRAQLLIAQSRRLYARRRDQIDAMIYRYFKPPPKTLVKPVRRRRDASAMARLQAVLGGAPPRGRHRRDRSQH